MDVFSPVLCVFLYVAVVSTVPVPDRIRISSLDMSLFLEWDPPVNSSSQTFNYTSELVRKYSGNEQVCPSGPALSCDFTESVSLFGLYNLRVRAEQNGSVSEWVQTEVFSLDKITIVSAPQVKLLSRKGQIEVEITDPPNRQLRVLRKVDPGVSYFIRYWKKDAAEESNVTMEQNVVWLQHLEPAVDYCVQVTILFFNRQSITSNTTCLINSTNDDASPWFIAAMVLVGFLVAVVVVLLLFLLGWSGYKGFQILNPDTELPEHLKMCLAQAPQSSVFWAMQNCPQPNEQFQQVQILIRDQEQDDEAHPRTETEESEQAAPHTGNTLNKCLL